MLYGGRIDPGKGCEELIEYFSTYVQEGGDASLVLMGIKLMPLPEEPFIRFAGRLSDQERLQALEAATVVVVPSPYESLSLLALESFAVGTPILANARSEVLVEHCHRSNAGLYYADRDEFGECLQLLVADAPAARRDGAQRPPLRQAELSLGCDSREVRADVRQAAAGEDVKRRQVQLPSQIPTTIRRWIRVGTLEVGSRQLQRSPRPSTTLLDRVVVVRQSSSTPRPRPDAPGSFRRRRPASPASGAGGCRGA